MEEALLFKSQKEFERWLGRNHSKSNGIGAISFDSYLLSNNLSVSWAFVL